MLRIRLSFDSCESHLQKKVNETHAKVRQNYTQYLKKYFHIIYQ